MLFYSTPETKTENISLSAQGQYGFVVTAEGCPVLAGSQKFGLTQHSVLECTDDLAGLKADNNFNIEVTCLNIPGTYTLTTNHSAASFGGGLNCSFGQSVEIPYVVSPELPEDCIVATFTELGSTSSFDACSAK